MDDWLSVSLVYDLGPGALVAVWVAITIGAIVQGSVGFGLAVLAAPLLALIEPRLLPGPMLLAGFVLGALMVYRDRESIHLGGIGWAILGRLGGTIVAAVFFAGLPRDTMSVLFGVLVLLAVAMSASGVHVLPTRWTVLVAGTLSGFMGTITSIGGPPMALVYQAERGARIRGTLSGFFMVGTAGSVTALAVVGRFGRSELLATLLLLPGILAGFTLSSRVATYLDRGRIRPVILILSTIAGLAVLARSLLALQGSSS